MRSSVRALVVAATCLLLVPSSVGAAASPRASLAAILAAGRAQRSVHYVAIADNGTSRTRLVCDVATTSGIQRITYQEGGRTGKVTVLVNAGTAYIRGDSFVLSTYLGFNPVGAAKSAGKWIRIPHSDRAYAPVSAAVTLRSTIDEFELDGPLSFLPAKTVAGQKTIGIKGRWGSRRRRPRSMPAPTARRCRSARSRRSARRSTRRSSATGTSRFAFRSPAGPFRSGPPGSNDQGLERRPRGAPEGRAERVPRRAGRGGLPHRDARPSPRRSSRPPVSARCSAGFERSGGRGRQVVSVDDRGEVTVSPAEPLRS